MQHATTPRGCCEMTHLMLMLVSTWDRVLILACIIFSKVDQQECLDPTESPFCVIDITYDRSYNFLSNNIISGQNDIFIHIALAKKTKKNCNGCYSRVSI